MLTIAGIMLAIGFTVGLLSISEGFMRSIDELFEGPGLDLMVSPRYTTRLPFGFQGPATLDETLAVPLRKVPGVKSVEPAYFGISPDGGGADFAHPMTIVAGIPAASFSDVHPDANVIEGRFFNDRDGHVVVLGAMVAKNTNKKIGDTISLITGPKLVIVGILERKNRTYDYMAYAPYATMQRIFDGEGRATFFSVKVMDGEKIDTVAARIRKQFKTVDVQSTDELVSSMKKMMSVARVVHLSISCFALIIGVLFVACTMVMSVSERVREFATLRVIGSSGRFIIKLIVTESVMLSAIGGVAGCLFGFGLSRIIDFVTARSFGDSIFTTLTSPRIIATGMAISVLIGVIAGIIPAWMILRKNLSECLRYE